MVLALVDAEPVLAAHRNLLHQLLGEVVVDWDAAVVDRHPFPPAELGRCPANRRVSR